MPESITKECTNYPNNYDQEAREKLREKLNVKVNRASVDYITRTSPPYNRFSHATDNEMLGEAFTNYSTSGLNVVEEVFRKTLSRKLYFMRLFFKRFECCSSECRDLKGNRIKVIYVIELDYTYDIKNLLIGKFFAQGSFTNVYLTFNHKAILIPRKDICRPQMAYSQMLRAYENCRKIHFLYDYEFEHSQRIEALLISLNLFQNDFDNEKKLIKKLLPPLPEKIKHDSCLITILPKATPSVEIFDKAPKNATEILQRLRIIADVATTLALLHEKNFVHGDIKPGNLLVNSEGVGQLHDFGGSNFFNNHEDNSQTVFNDPDFNDPDFNDPDFNDLEDFKQNHSKAFFDNRKDILWTAEKYASLSTTPLYTHDYDVDCYELYKKSNGSKTDFLQLGQARDVFALAVSTIRAMIGGSDPRGNAISPYNVNAYTTRKNGSHTDTFIYGTEKQRTPITCIKAFVPEVDAEFEALLDFALNPDWFLRAYADEFAVGLHRICEKIKTTLPSAKG